MREVLLLVRRSVNEKVGYGGFARFLWLLHGLGYIRGRGLRWARCVYFPK